MPDPFLGEIRLVPYNFAPQGWAFCDGQILPIAQNTALFALIGTTYGGNGSTTFALPDLRGRVPIHAGQGPGLSIYPIGQTGGVETVAPSITTSLSETDEPHAHELVGSPTGPGVGVTSVATVPSASGASSSAPVHENRQPYLALHYIIAVFGVFPSQG